MIEGRVLVDGAAAGPALVLAEPLSFWGGLDPGSGAIVDNHHPQRGAVMVGTVLFLPSSRGSSSSPSVLAEALRMRTAPAGILLGEPDPMVVLGVVVADELYGRAVPVVVVPNDHGITTGVAVTIESGGVVAVSGP